ncbi:MAG: hypothetical protein KUG77_28200 [Nannocystaceae bacterium]|nr:hypothetical protein [Nannocystaceae bacterium]
MSKLDRSFVVLRRIAGRAFSVTALCLAIGACDSATDPEGEGDAGDASSGSADDGGVILTTGADGDGDGDGGDASMSGPGDGDGGDDAGDAGDGGSDDGGDDGGFISPPDGGIVGQCDPATQDCPRGQKCTSYVATPGGNTVDATRCVEVIGDAQWGESCERMTDNDTCAAGFFCMTDVSGNTGEGRCLEYCEINQPCEFGGECFAFNDGALPVCEVTCDPLAPACPDNQGCYAAFNSFVCAIPGAPDGQGADGDPCNTIQSCNPGLVCRTGTAGCAAEAACCSPFCDMSEGDTGCPEAGESCIQALDEPPPGLEDVGYCGIPA